MVLIPLLCCIMIILYMVRAIKGLVKGKLNLFIQNGLIMCAWWFGLIGSAVAVTVANS